MKKIELEKHKFDTRWRFAVLVLLLIFAAFLQYTKSPMANEFVTLLIGIVAGNLAHKRENYRA